MPGFNACEAGRRTDQAENTNHPSCSPRGGLLLTGFEAVAKAPEKKGTTKTRRHKVFSGPLRPADKKGFLCALVSLWFNAFMLFATTSFQVVTKGRVILAKAGTHFSPHTPEGTEKVSKSRLFLRKSDSTFLTVNIKGLSGNNFLMIVQDRYSPLEKALAVRGFRAAS